MLFRAVLAGAASILCAAHVWCDSLGAFKQTNLVSDIPGLAANTDPNLINPWGISESSSSPFWISDNGKGLTTLYNSAGTPLSLVVAIPSFGSGTSAPTGQVFNGTGSFSSDVFLFATENGTIAGWRGSLGTTAETLYNNSGSGASYKGITLATNAQGSYILAANFTKNSVDVFPSSGAGSLPGKFVDPTLPAGYAPFNVQNIGGQIFVTYAKQGTGIDEVDGAGNGFVSVFDSNGNFVSRVASNGKLNSPWGLAVAPASWGALSGDLLVGNFGDGTINAYTLSGTFVGTLDGVNGSALVNDGLWGLTFGNGGNGGSTDSLYLAAGLNDENDGLFAKIDPTPEPGSFVLLGLGVSAIVVFGRRVRVKS